MMLEGPITTKLVFKRVVLVVPDHDLRKSLQAMMLDGPYLPLTASNGRHALMLLESWDFSPGLIVVDLAGADPSMKTFIDDLRARERFRHVSIVALTTAEQSLEVLKRPGVSVLRKPFTVADFKTAVRTNFRVN